jgi:putative transcriptional regulator
MKIVLRIDEILQEKGKSAYWLAHQTGLNESGLVRIRKQRTQGIQWDTLLKLCTALECQPGDLIVMVDEQKEAKKEAKSKS